MKKSTIVLISLYIGLLVMGYVLHLDTIKTREEIRQFIKSPVADIVEKPKEDMPIAMAVISDYYNNTISEPFKSAKKIIEKRNNIIVIINAVHRFLPQVLGLEYPFDELDILAIIDIESDWDPTAVSPKNAKGLLQILDCRTYIERVDGVKDPFDINCSVYAGLRVLKDKYDRWHDKNKAIIAYNGVVKNKDGTWKDIYLKKYNKSRRTIDEYINKEQS